MEGNWEKKERKGKEKKDRLLFLSLFFKFFLFFFFLSFFQKWTTFLHLLWKKQKMRVCVYGDSTKRRRKGGVLCRTFFSTQQEAAAMFVDGCVQKEKSVLCHFTLTCV